VIIRILGISTLLLAGAHLLPERAAADSMDVSAGRTLALQWCSNCHVVAKGQTQAATDSAPSFFAIANDSSTTEAGLRAFLGTPHPTMPNIALSRGETTDLIDYILSLEGQ
jgi:mono/diheme cytochrome c family protein